MARKSRRRKRSVSSDESTDSSDDDSSDDSLSNSDSASSLSSDSESDSSKSDSDSSDSDASDSDSESSESDFDESKFPDEDPSRSVEEIRELIRDARVMKYENAVIEKAGIDNYSAMRDCDERKLKRLGMGYTDRDRLLQAFRKHLEGITEKNKERWERQKEIKKGGKKKGKGKSRSKSKSSKSSKSRSKSKKSRGKSKSSKSSKSSKGSKSKKGKYKAKPKTKVDPDEALRKLDTGWSGKRQAWADYKQHEARVAELVEFYDEIGKKRTNAEDHARKLLCSYPGGINKLVIALDKKYHHIPYGWEDLLEEAYRLQEYEGSGSD